MLYEEKPRRVVVHRVERDEWVGIPREVFRVDYVLFKGNTLHSMDVLVPARDEIEVFQKFPRHMKGRYGVTNIEWRIGDFDEATKV
jgi:hypothetical protein